MKIKYIKNNIACKACKGLSKHRTKTNRKISKTMTQKYREGLKDFYESLPQKDFRGVDKETLQKYKEKYLKVFKKYPKKDMSIIDIKRALKDL